MGLQDFAGGTVVHITAGVAALVAAVMMGSRKGFGSTAMPPHNLTMTVTGAGMLWVGWFGFNAGSALAADNSAAMAMLVTHLSAACGSLAWMAMDLTTHMSPWAGIISRDKPGKYCSIKCLFVALCRWKRSTAKAHRFMLRTRLTRLQLWQQVPSLRSLELGKTRPINL